MQALSAVHYVFCTGLYGDDYSEGGNQQRISKASTRGDLHPAASVHAQMLFATDPFAACNLMHLLLSERTSAGCIPGCQPV